MSNFFLKIFLFFLLLFLNFFFFNFFNEEILLFICFSCFLFFFYFYISAIIAELLDEKISGLRILILKIFFEIKSFIIEKKKENEIINIIFRYVIFINFFFFKIFEERILKNNKVFNELSIILVNNFNYFFLIITEIFKLYKVLIILSKSLNFFFFKVLTFGANNSNINSLKKKLYGTSLINNYIFNFFFINFLEE